MTPPPPSTTAARPAKAPLVPPEERFWQRYSPHHEFPLSSLLSLLAHAAVAAVLVWVVGRALFGSEKTRPIPMDTIVIAGGGGNPEGIGDAPGNGAPPQAHREAVETSDKHEKAPTEAVKDKPKVDTEALTAPVEADPLKLPEFANDRVLNSGNSSLAGLSKLSQDTQRKMLEGLAVAGKGQGGPGSGGGKGAGKGKGTGDLEGEGKGRISVRQKRLLRWTMKFDIHHAGDARTNGEEYARQLEALGAILAIPDPRGGYQVVRDLRRRPVHGKIEDLAKINRIFWVDDKPETVGPLCYALGVRPVPPHIVAFFPEELEAELLDKELKYQGRSEDQIKETVFRVVRLGGGRYVPEVEEQH